MQGSRSDDGTVAQLRNSRSRPTLPRCLGRVYLYGELLIKSVVAPSFFIQHPKHVRNPASLKVDEEDKGTIKGRNKDKRQE